MLGPASLRSQKSSIKTYGGRQRRQQQQLNTGAPSWNGGDGSAGSRVHGDELEGAAGSRPPSRQFEWDRLDKARKERLDRQAKEQERLARAEDETAFLRQDVDLEALLYSDHEDEDGVQDMAGGGAFQDMRSSIDTAPRREYVLTRESDGGEAGGRHSQTRTSSGPRTSITQQPLPPARTRGHRPATNSSSRIVDSDQEYEIPRRVSIAHTEPATSSILSGRSSMGRKSSGSSGRVSFSIDTADSVSQKRKVVFQEKSFFEQDFREEDEDEDEDEVEDEVLFRTPSFDILKKLRELPTAKIPEPRANPFGFRPLSSTSKSKSSPSPSSKRIERESSRELDTPPPAPPTAHDFFDNPFVSPESPTIKRTMEILRKREQQLEEIQAKNQGTTKDGIEVDGDNKMTAVKADKFPLAFRDFGGASVRSGQGIIQRDRKRPSVSRETTPERSTTPKNGADGGMGSQDECVDMALGKRMSSIEITPRRLLAKQRKTAPYDSDSPTKPLGAHIHFSPRATFDKVMDEAPVRPLKLFLDRDIPKDEDPELHDILFPSSQDNKTPSLFNSITSTQPRMSTAGSDLNRLLWPPKDDDRENRHPRDGSENGGSPFTSSSTSNKRPGQPSMTTSRPHWLKSPSPQRTPLISVTSNQGALPYIPVQKSVPVQQYPHSQPQLQSQHQPQPQPQPTPTPHQQQTRVARSLRRPPAVLVNHSKKAVFKPTVTDLLSICDQQFFEQFKDTETTVPFGDTAQAAGGGDGSKKPKAIVDFDAVLPKSMMGSLTKIGEASYSEVYTVDLPIQLYEQRIRDSLQQSPNQIPNLFRSPRLNTYVKESAEDDLNQPSNDAGGVGGGGTRSTKLVMKVLPFYDEQFDTPPAGLSSPLKGSRKNKSKSAAAAAAAELLALEDIYREAMVSTQIMHGWKGFIGSFGHRQGNDGQLFRNIPTFGIVVQMIDFTLARVQGDKGNLIYMDMEKDEDLFKGQGDYQFDIYRKMRRQIGKDWTASCPRTNLFWLHYIADKLLSEKQLEQPKPNPFTEAAKTSSTLYTTKSLTALTTPRISDPRTPEEQLERWCYERVVAISEMNLDRMDPSGQTPSAMVLDQLLLDRPSWLI
ncbi:Serine/threonine-protein kinase haspin [Linnemannia exigua]|uniref:non-specific serine/threonine protein kinase n=1 Tax=Linnemannia exigua TaxID=604196 RepID=A0AAD4D7J3_9FUNG|nr:Serine/threonine-protein kinase haspin [Linnemannia exigua]